MMAPPSKIPPWASSYVIHSQSELKYMNALISIP